MAERLVGIAQGLKRSRERLEQRRELRKIASLRVGDGARQPGGYVGRHQNVSVPRTLIGIM